MSIRTVTRDLELVADGDRGNLTIFPITSSNEQVQHSSFLVKFTMKSNSSILNRTGLHWHETHTEYLRVSSGKAFVTVDGKTWIIDSTSGEICIPIGVVHEWGFAEENGNEDLIIWERTEPADGSKEIFFRNLVSSLIDSSIGNPFSSQSVNRRLSIRDILQFFVTFRALDNYPVFWNGIGKRYITYSILNIGDLLGRSIFGLKPFYIEYTPQWLWDTQKLKHQ